MQDEADGVVESVARGESGMSTLMTQDLQKAASEMLKLKEGHRLTNPKACENASLKKAIDHPHSETPNGILDDGH